VTSWLMALRLALRSLLRNKLRAGLTMLGILIGVAAVVIVVALGEGVRSTVATQTSSMGANTIFVFSQPSASSGARSRDGGRLTEGDAQAILREATSIVAVAPWSAAAAQVLAGDRNMLTQVMGVTQPYLQVRGFSVAHGRTWTESDETLKSKVCVIGDTVREQLFGTADAVGQYVRIGKYAFRVVGVLQKKGQSPFGENQDDRVLMPIGSFRARVAPSPPGRVQMLIASASDERTVDRATKQIEQILRQRHHIEPADEPDFSLFTQTEVRAVQDAIFGVLTALLSSIAAVSLIVGGIGVMNIMLVSVTERTREIGIRMAIGARQVDIQMQFLAEAVLLSLLGGIIGLGLAALVVRLLGNALEWDMPVPLEAVIVAFGTSAAVGVVFGYLPARRAAALDPIEALRHE
jgi:putative ABC transport system permease protein